MFLTGDMFWTPSSHQVTYLLQIDSLFLFVDAGKELVLAV